MKKIIFLFSTVFLLMLPMSCEKDDVEEKTDNSEFTSVARDFMYTIMNKWYYWYDLMPKVTKDEYSDPYLLLEAMRYKTLDKWSFVADYDEFTAEMEGTFVGHGFRIGLDDSGKARIAMIYKNSPLYTEGVRRGWLVKTVNGKDIASIISSGDATAYNNVMGESTAGITNTFVFQKPDGTDVTISSAKAEFDVNSVLLYDTLHLTSGVTGHLVFDSFIKPSENELATAFAYFKANDVKDLILDLRYNTGGYLYIAQQLASYIAGNGLTSGTSFAELSYNSKNQSENQSFSFISTSYPLSLSKLVVITTRSTASASEAVMNGLKPFMNIVSIGDTTNGKPVGMNGWAVGETYYFWPITFKMVNADNEGEYFDGIAPSQIASDDITHDFTDRNETCLNGAIHYLETGILTTKGATSFKRSAQFSEKPAWMNNAFVKEKEK
jgi:carboxyl-terminal processing protease